MTKIHFEEFVRPMMTFYERAMYSLRFPDTNEHGFVCLADIESLKIKKVMLEITKRLKAPAILMFPGVNSSRHEFHMLTLRQMDCELGIHQHEMRPLALVHAMPQQLRTGVFADYAESLSLPYAAKIMKAGIDRFLPQEPEEFAWTKAFVCKSP